MAYLKKRNDKFNEIEVMKNFRSLILTLSCCFDELFDVSFIFENFSVERNRNLIVKRDNTVQS